jgi:DNA polymerase-3 subunit gamma/tau
MLSNHSFNLLLKTLEEPYDHIKFILATTEHYKIPHTILSRCIILNLKKISTYIMTSHLIMIAKLEKIKSVLL